MLPLALRAVRAIAAAFLARQRVKRRQSLGNLRHIPLTQICQAVAIVVLSVRVDVGDLILQLRRHVRERVGRHLGQLALLPRLCDLLRFAQPLANHLQPRQLALADLAHLGDMVAHPAGELHALLLQLVEKLLHALGLRADVRVAHPARVAIGVDQP